MRLLAHQVIHEKTIRRMSQVSGRMSQTSDFGFCDVRLETLFSEQVSVKIRG